MGNERDGSKNGGGYAGGFFQLFDWTAKSRKKLFSSKSDFPERLKQGKKSDGNLPMTRLHLMEEDETGAGSSFKGSSDYSCASSVTDDDGYGARAPGVVARLMGLDSLPTSSEPYSTPLFDTQSLRDSHYSRKNLDYQHDQQIMYSGSLLNKVEGHSREFVGSKPQKIISRPIEKFQTEILPPKSAKSIPITHHKLLSPIKSHGSIPTKNAMHIMEAAAKIIEPGPQANIRAKMPLVGPSSVPLRVRDLKEKAETAQKTPLAGSSLVSSKSRDLKEKAEAAHKTSRLGDASSRRPVESNAAKYLKGQSLNKSWNGSVDTTSFRASDTEEGASSVKSKGKSISLAIQAKVNVQRREGLSSSSSRSLVTQKEHNDIKLSQPFKSQPSIQKNMHKKSCMHNSSGVLRQNNQKQNCVMDKDKLPSRPSVSSSQGRKMLSGDSSTTRQRTMTRTVVNSKAGSRKLGSDVRDGDKGDSYSTTKNVPRKKRSIDREFHYEKNQVVDHMLIDRSQKAIQANPVIDRNYTWAEDSKKKGMDVVSFTFTAPLPRSVPGSETSSGQVGQKNDGVFTDNRSKRLLLDTDSMKLSSLGYNVMGADALSMLLEQKLRELSNRTESSRHESFEAGSSSSSSSVLPDPVPTCKASNSSLRLQGKGDQHELDTDKPVSHYPVLRPKHKFQGVDVMEECSSNHLDTRQFLDCRNPSPVSVLETSFSTESCNSSDSADYSSTEGSKLCSSVQAQEVFSLSNSKKFHLLEADTELSDSASSTSIGSLAMKHANTTILIDLDRSSKWELGYIKQILCNVELMFKDFALGRAREIINPYLFDLLETRKGGMEIDGDESKLSRKVVFDCVSECMDLRCRQYAGGGCRTWARGVAIVRRKDRLAEEVHREISGWRGMGDCMVDELVDKDMSSQHGRWLDFEVDEFALGVEVEGQIFNSLINELVADIFQF